MIFSWTAKGETWYGLLTNNKSASCYTSKNLSDLTRRAAADGIGAARTRRLTKREIHELAFGFGEVPDDVAFEWVDADAVTERDKDVVMREGVAITVTGTVRTRTVTKDSDIASR